jgi:hypothetical protein
MYRRGLAIKRALLGRRHPDVAITLNNLGTALQDAGRDREAIVVFEEAVAILVSSLSARHPKTVACLENLQGAVRERSRGSRGGR